MKITITGSEGRTEAVEAMRGRVFESFDAADAAIATLHERDGYMCKVWFQIEIDGNEYAGRYDALNPKGRWHATRAPRSLRAHVITFNANLLADTTGLVECLYGKGEPADRARSEARHWLRLFGATRVEVARCAGIHTVAAVFTPVTEVARG